LACERPAIGAVTEDVSDRILRLPFYNQFTEVEQQKVVEAIHEFAL
jgi:dTDP-4-amino-4,6-dideoxygalactose transaminase